MRPKAIFGREPALWLAVVQAILNIGVGFGLDGLSAEQAAIWMAVVNAALSAVTAWAVRPVAPIVFTGLFSAVATLGAAYGLDFSQEMVASINVVIVALVTLIARGEISPAEDAHRTGVLGDKVTTPR